MAGGDSIGDGGSIMIDILPAIIIGYCALSFVMIIISVSLDIRFYAMLPWDLHDDTDMNLAGCIVVSVLAFVLFAPIWITRFFYWLFHI